MSRDFSELFFSLLNLNFGFSLSLPIFLGKEYLYLVGLIFFFFSCHEGIPVTQTKEDVLILLFLQFYLPSLFSSCS